MFNNFRQINYKKNEKCTAEIEQLIFWQTLLCKLLLSTGVPHYIAKSVKTQSIDKFFLIYYGEIYEKK